MKSFCLKSLDGVNTSTVRVRVDTCASIRCFIELENELFILLRGCMYRVNSRSPLSHVFFLEKGLSDCKHSISES